MSAPRPRKMHDDIERHYFEQFRQTYPLPNGAFSYGDKPDVTLTAERKIGIEVTRFYLSPGGCADSDQRQQPLRTAIVANRRHHAAFAEPRRASSRCARPLSPKLTHSFTAQAAKGLS
jgi:hypothetical protein